MKCCAQCIGDRHLRKDVFLKPDNEIGVCEYCGSANQHIIDASLLRDSFELLLGCYAYDEQGRSLAECLMEDWSMFTSMDVAHVKALLADILDDGNIVRQCFVPVDNSSSALDIWADFKRELMHENRFFPTTALNPDRLEELLNYLIYDAEDYPGDNVDVWFRARIQNGDEVYLPKDMGAPPCHLALHGRANPAGIPYLYLASNKVTAISEIRPHTGETANVAEFTILQDLKMVDLRHPRKTVSPFKLGDEAEIVLLRGDISFLDSLGEELMHPVLPHAAAIDYIPSQYLCEFVKKCGFDGVMYRSSVGDGINIALFDPKKAAVGNVTTIQVTRVTVELDE